MMMMRRRRPLFSLSPGSRQNHHRRHRRRRPIDDDAVTRIIDGRRNKAVALDEDDEYVDLDELFDDDRPSNRKTLFDLTPALTEKKGNLQKRKNITIEVPEVVKSKAAVLAEETYGDEEEEMDVEGNTRSGEDDDEFDDEDLVRKVVRSVDGILDNVEKESEQNFLVKGTWETFKKGEKIAMNPSVQKGAKIVQKVSVETVKVATPIVAKGVATGIKEGGKLAFKVALGANSMGNERRKKKEAKKIVENKSNGNSPSWKKNEGVFKTGKVLFSFGNVDEKEEENRNVFGSLFGGDGKNESQTPPKKKRTDIFGRERD